MSSYWRDKSQEAGALREINSQMHQREQQLLNEIAVLKQKNELQAEEIASLKEREALKKELHEKMINALQNNNSTANE